MPRKYKFRCTECGVQPGDTQETARKNLFVKRVEFRRYGFKGSAFRTRTVAWLCRACMRADSDYNRPENQISDVMVE